MTNRKRMGARISSQRGAGLVVSILALLVSGCGGGARVGAGSLVRVSQTVAVVPLPSTVPAPASASGSDLQFLSSISCPSANGCVAAGRYFSSGVEGGFLPVDVQGSWSANDVSGDLPQSAASPAHFGLSSVACPSVGNCTAVGSFTNSQGALSGLLISQSNGHWGAGVQVPSPADAAGSVTLKSVSCASVGSCTAVGYYANSSGDAQPLITTSSAGGTATSVKAPLPANASAGSTDSSLGGSGLGAVSCPTTNSCAAIGTYYDSKGMLQGLLLDETGSGWTATEAPLPAGAQPNADPNYFGLTAISCPAAGSCAAVGYYNDNSGEQGLLLTLSGGSWSAQAVKVPSDAAQSSAVSLNSVACVSAGNCTAVGGYTDSSGVTHGLFASETGGSWSQGVAASLPTTLPTSTSASLSVVACESQTGDCAAIGVYNGSGGVQQGLIVTGTGGTWGRGVAALLPASADPTGNASLNAVDCAPSGGCTAAGTFTNHSQQGLPFAVSISTAASG